MKKTLTIISAIILACSCSDFFEKTPANEFDADIFFKSEADLKLYANGLINAALPDATDMTLGEDVYTVGDYTFKLTLTYTLGGWNSKCNLVVVVADKSGANLFTVEYRGSNFYDIAANGEIMTFTCNKYDHQRIEILREYGIDFPAKKEYTVSGLKKVTNLDLRDNFDFLFSGEDGNISLAVTPKSEFLLEGPYTIRLSVETVSSWWSSEIQLKFSVEETATGTEVANGYYYVTAISGLYEGNEIYVSAHFEQYDIGAATGLVLDDGNALLIVSTK
jgi:hypothetical protein